MDEAQDAGAAGDAEEATGASAATVDEATGETEAPTEAPADPAPPAADPAAQIVSDLGGLTSLTSQGKAEAEKALGSVTSLEQHLFAVGEAGLEDAVKVINELQTKVSNLLSTATNLLHGRVKSAGSS